MSEWSGWWTTDDTGDGAASGYTQVELGYVAKVLAACSGFEGVAPGLLNECNPTANGANTVAVNTGGALVDGKPYHNSASVDVNVPSASGAGNTRIDRIVLRAGWAAQTVRITRIAGTDAASPTAPALTQTTGTTYDISLCTVLVTEAGAVTVTDARTMASPYQWREGGSATDWSTPGTTLYVPSQVRMETGVREITIASGSGPISIGFQYDFGQPPTVFTSVETAGATGTRVMVVLRAIVTTGFQGYIQADDGASTWDGTVNLHWLAIGPAA